MIGYRVLRRFLPGCCFLVMMIGVGCAPAPKVGSEARDFTALDSQGRTHSSRGYDGKVAVFYFWASWCAPCIVAGPAIQRIHDKYKGDDRVVVLAVNFDDTGAPVEYCDNHGYTFPMVPDGREVVRAYDIKKLPTILVISPLGAVTHSQIGFRKSDEEDIVAAIESQLR